MKNESFPGLAILYQSVDSLTPYTNNARTHSTRQIRQIANSIRSFGFTNPILVTGNGRIAAGQGRLEAAKLLGMELVPTIRLEGLTDDQIRAYMLTDNRLAEKAGWDNSILAIELQHLTTVHSNFDVTITGFDVPEIDVIIEEVRTKLDDKDDLFQFNEAAQPVTQYGDLWQLGKHRIMCGNSLDESSFKLLMARRQANVAFVDPPYNVVIDGHATGNGQIHHKAFAMASGEMNEVEYATFLNTSLRLLARHSTPTAISFACIDWRHLADLVAAGRQIFDSVLNICVWVKNNAGMGSFYRSQHEFICVFRNGRGHHRNNVQLGKFGRNRTNVWQYPGVNALSRQGEEGNLLALHPTVKPVTLVADALLDASARGEIVLDSFLGSGTTLIAAERVGRICFGIEIDPIYVDVGIRRWQKHTGDDAIHAATGKAFNAMAVEAGVKGGRE